MRATAPESRKNFCGSDGYRRDFGDTSAPNRFGLLFVSQWSVITRPAAASPETASSVRHGLCQRIVGLKHLPTNNDYENISNPLRHVRFGDGRLRNLASGPPGGPESDWPNLAFGAQPIHAGFGLDPQLGDCL
jgi:hypothetical protein